MFANLIPRGQEAEFYGLFSMAHLIFQWSGTLLFTVVNEKFNSLRMGVLFQAVLIAPAAIIQFTIPDTKPPILYMKENQATTEV